MTGSRIGLGTTFYTMGAVHGYRFAKSKNFLLPLGGLGRGWGVFLPFVSCTLFSLKKKERLRRGASLSLAKGAAEEASPSSCHTRAAFKDVYRR